MHRIALSFLCVYLLIASALLYPFDPIYYLAHNQANLTIKPYEMFIESICHFGAEGLQKKLRTAPEEIQNTNFDWEYYIEHNHLNHIPSEQKAHRHYRMLGRFKGLSYCKHYTIAILVHFHDLDIIETLLRKIENFIHNNPTNTYIVYTNITITDKIFDQEVRAILPQTPTSQVDISLVKKLSPYHDYLITARNAPMLYTLKNYIEAKLRPLASKVRVLFSENRGMDIGGFLLTLDAINKDNVDFDFLIKLHTKKGGPQFPCCGNIWRELLVSFLNIRVNKLLARYECIYSCSIRSEDDPWSDLTDYTTKKNILCNALGNIDRAKPYTFCGGTMFIVSRKFYDFIKKFDLLALYNTYFEQGKPATGIGYEHVFERLFGYFFDELHLKKLTLGYYGEDTPPVLPVHNELV